ncbi:MAG: hypothetical protein RLZZ385_2755 [Pseudomonadota bacterium]|jgi:hypothetical protein
MPTAILGPYTRTIVTAALLVLLLGFSVSGLRVDIWTNLLPFFEWMETTWFGVIGKTWGAAFAVVEAFHLLAMALLGGSVIITDGRLLGLMLTDVPARTVVDRAMKTFNLALAVVLFTGVFMACGVATKIYYLPVYWYKMLALAFGILFVYFVKQPLLKNDISKINPWVLRGVAVSSVMIWFTVAATGRWIGFSG